MDYCEKLIKISDLKRFGFKTADGVYLHIEISFKGFDHI
jgi:hypothetical protein